MLISLHRPIPNDIGQVSQWFGEHPEWYGKFSLAGHNGIDYAVPATTPVLAAHDGIVRLEGYDPEGYGIYMYIISDRFQTLYAHLSKPIVEHGQAVIAQQSIALSGNSGNSTGPHLHFGLKIKGMHNQAYRDWIDPVPFRDI
jgi:murein DD-endopeptidase MepM/ murein hydrolase activator NlpD